MAQKHDKSTLEAIREEKEKAEKKVRYYKDREQFLRHQVSTLNRKERTNRLCTRAGMLESFLQRPSELTNDQVMELLKIAFRQEPVTAALNRMLEEIREREKYDENETSENSILE